MTRLNSFISPSGAHVMDVQYHKSSWRNNVFHVIRDEASRPPSSTKKEVPLQIPCLIELINVIDIQIKNQAYLHMDDVERMLIICLEEWRKQKKNIHPH